VRSRLAVASVIVHTARVGGGVDKTGDSSLRAPFLNWAYENRFLKINIPIPKMFDFNHSSICG
jgi:hypothetical protein